MKKMWSNPAQWEWWVWEGRWGRNTRDGVRILHAAPVGMMDTYRQYMLSVLISSAGQSFAIWR